MAEEETCECLAAPDIANQILVANGIETRYATGDYKNNGTEIYSNYISEVAHAMSNEAVFPAYPCDLEWDGETYIDKCDVDAYYLAVYNFLRFKGADLEAIPCDFSDEVEVTFVLQGGSTEVTVTIPKKGSSLDALQILKIKPTQDDKLIDFFDGYDFDYNTWGSSNNNYYWGVISQTAEQYEIVFHFDGTNTGAINVYVEFSEGSVIYICDRTWDVVY